MPEIEGSLCEIEYALDTLKCDGIVMLTNYGGQYLGNSIFEDAFKELNKRKTVVYVHPADPPGRILLGEEIPNFLMEVTFDTTRAILNLFLHMQEEPLRF